MKGLVAYPRLLCDGLDGGRRWRRLLLLLSRCKLLLQLKSRFLLCKLCALVYTYMCDVLFPYENAFVTLPFTNH